MIIENRYLSLPVVAQLEITDICNHRCLHCYNFDFIDHQTKKVNDETVVACAQKIIDSGVFSAVVTGGEPLVKKELARKIIMLFHTNNIRVSLNSNLTLIDDEFISFLKQVNVGVLTSCPSAVPVSYKKLTDGGNYTEFEYSLKRLRKANVNFTANMVVTRDNLHEVRITAERMYQLGCHSFAATPMALNVNNPRLDLLVTSDEIHEIIYDLLWVKETFDMNVDILEALPKCAFPEKVLNEEHIFLNRKCQAGRTGITVSCNGDVRPCSHNPNSYGNLLYEDLRDIWAKMNDWRSIQYIPEECKKCTWLTQCNGGCRTNAKAVSGKWNTKDIRVASTPLQNITAKT